jgi:hypothetical protein
LQRQEDKDISDIYDTLCEILPKIHYDYDIIGEHHLLDAQISNGRLKISSEECELPPLIEVDGFLLP